MFGMKVTGIGTVQVQLSNISRRVADNSRKVLGRKAEKIAGLASRMAPRDTAALEESIRVERGYESGRGRLYINVVAANKVVTLPNGRTVDLNDYALIIHETYGSMNPGPNTVAKQAADPSVLVGERFMTRAAEQVAPEVSADIYKVIAQIINEESPR